VYTDPSWWDQHYQNPGPISKGCFNMKKLDFATIA
jgi:hypothetical protein